MYGNSVVPLYIYDSDTKKYHSMGSSVLISHKEQLFFITAAHVLESMKGRQSHIYFENTFFKMSNIRACISDCSQYLNRNDDPVDLAAIPVPKQILNTCDRSKFITIKNYIDGELCTSNIFQVIGYPQAKNTKAVRRTANIPGGFKADGIRYTGLDISSTCLPYKDIDESSHIATTLSKSGYVQGTRNLFNIPDLHGLSGGLLQKVNSYNSDTDSFEVGYPAGIILQKKPDNSSIISIRLSAVFTWLDIQWPTIQSIIFK